MTPSDPFRPTRKQALRMLALAGGAAAAPGLFGAAFAQAEHDGHDTGGGMMMAAPGDSPSTEAYVAANMRMHAAMDIAYTGDADVDFVHGMIAHHRGAIDMAKVVIEYGSDPEIRRLAEEIVSAQEDEISFMEAWLATHGG